jgi:pimeloyl-ACP methyl ester carboxylesterase
MEVSLPQGTIRYRDSGSGEPIVFLHGLLVNGRLWERVADRLEPDFRCIVPDLPLGSHVIPMNADTDLSPPGVARLAADFLEKLGLERVTLVGNDSGGAISQIVATKHPDRIGRLVLTNCDAFDKFPPFPFNMVFALLRGPATIKTLFATMRLRPLRHSPLGFGLLMDADPQLTDSWLDPCRKDSRICRNLATLLRHVAVTDLTDVSTRLGNFTKPVTIVWGMRDRSFTPSLGRRLAAQFPNATFVEVPKARTFVALDDPDAVIGAIEKISAPS